MEIHASQRRIRRLIIGFLGLIASVIVVPVISISTTESVASAAGAPTTIGRSFTLVYPPNLNDEAMRIHISSARTGTATYSIGGGASTTVNLTANVATTVNLPSTSHLQAGSGTAEATIPSKVVKVTTNVDASVYADSNGMYISDATTIIPDANLGTKYRVLSSKIGGSNYHRLIVVALENSTTFTVTPKTIFGIKSAGTPYSVTLNAGETYMLGSNSQGQDISGTLVESNKAVSVFVSADCEAGSNVSFPYTTRAQTGACDLLFEQVPPVQSLGRQFILNGFADRKQGGTPVRVMADQDGTTVTVNVNGTSSVVATLNAGEVFQKNYWEAAVIPNPTVSVNQGLFIQTSKPALVAAFMRGAGDYLGETGDPSVTFIPPFEQFLTAYTVVSAPGNAAQLMNLMVPTSATSSVLFDGNALTASNFENTWSPVAGTNYSVAQIKSTLGSHTLSADLAFGLVVYGANSYNSYAYVGGMSLSSIGLVDSVTLSTQVGYNGNVGQQVCVQAEVLDANGAGLNGVRVDGSISGVNSSTPLVGTSNESGVANLCYTSLSTGTDTVTLTSNQLTATTTVTWTEIAPNISYNPSTLSVVASSAMPSLSVTNAGSPATSWSVSPALPSGITLNSSTGQISGTPSAATASAGYTVTATNSSGSSTAVVTLEVTAAAVAPSISYSPSTRSFTLNATASPMIPTVTGTFPTWAVSPALPIGMVINSQNGVISGTPTELMSSTPFTVTATNTGGSVTTTVNIAVVANAPNISYSQSSVSYVVGTPVSTLLPTNTGSPAASWSVSPALPSGISFNSNTGQISGTPGSATAAADYTVTATNSAGFSTFVINITVAASLAAPNISYPSATLSLTVGSAMTAQIPSNSGGPVSTWSINPALPAGLSFTTSTGRISGTPSSLTASANYTVTGSNSAGVSTFVLAIEVVVASSSSSSSSTSTTTSSTTSTTVPVAANSTTSVPPVVTSTTVVVAGSQPGTVSAAGPSLAPNQFRELTVKRIVPVSHSSRQSTVSYTPGVCVSLGSRVFALATGTCRLQVTDNFSGRTLRTMRYSVVASDDLLTRAIPLEPIMYGYLSVFPLNSVRSIAKSITDGKEVIIVGHSAIFTGVNKWNTILAEKRSRNLKSLLRIFGVKVPITTVGVGASAPITRVLTEQQQQLNRRAMIYIVPNQP